MLKMSNCSLSLQQKKILNKLSLSVEPGEALLLVGKSGAGKSTLLRVIAHLEKLNEGDIYLAEKRETQQSLQLHNRVGIVFQSFNLFEHLNVRDNITLALIHVQKKTKQEAELIASDFLKKYQLIDYELKMPRDLSGGQRQRVAIIRTLVLNPEIILLDEPTSGLDPLLTEYIAEVIADLQSKNKIILIATHDISLIDKVKEAKICFLENGYIQKTLSAEEWRSKKGSHLEMFSFS